MLKKMKQLQTLIINKLTILVELQQQKTLDFWL